MIRERSARGPPRESTCEAIDGKRGVPHGTAHTALVAHTLAGKRTGLPNHTNAIVNAICRELNVGWGCWIHGHSHPFSRSTARVAADIIVGVLMTLGGVRQDVAEHMRYNRVERVTRRLAGWEELPPAARGRWLRLARCVQDGIYLGGAPREDRHPQPRAVPSFPSSARNGPEVVQIVVVQDLEPNHPKL